MDDWRFTVENQKGDLFLLDLKPYKGTPGLYKLRLMKHHNEDVYYETDQKAYKDILRPTDTHKHDYSVNARLDTNF